MKKLSDTRWNAISATKMQGTNRLRRSGPRRSRLIGSVAKRRGKRKSVLNSWLSNVSRSDLKENSPKGRSGNKRRRCGDRKRKGARS